MYLNGETIEDSEGNYVTFRPLCGAMMVTNLPMYSVFNNVDEVEELSETGYGSIKINVTI